MLTYLQQPTIAADENPLEWWEKHVKIFPTLAALAKTHLAAPPGSVPPEQMFSVAGQIYTKSRSRLRDFRVEMLLFIRQNALICPIECYQLASVSDVDAYFEKQELKSSAESQDSSESSDDCYFDD